jgi:hypothetical protein
MQKPAQLKPPEVKSMFGGRRQVPMQKLAEVKPAQLKPAEMTPPPPTPEEARTSLAAFVQLREQLPNEVHEQRQFIQQWTGQPVHWRVYVHTVLLDNKGNVASVYSSSEANPDLVNRLQPISAALFSTTMPAQLLEQFTGVRLSFWSPDPSLELVEPYGYKWLFSISTRA